MQDDSKHLVSSDQRARDTKFKWEFFKLKIEVAALILAFIYILATSLGGALLYIYFFRYQFNPGGLSVADALSFSLTSFGFFLTVSIGLLLATLAGFSLARCIHFMVTSFFNWRARNKVASPEEEMPKRTREFEWRKDYEILLILSALTLFIFLWLAFTVPSGGRGLILTFLGIGAVLSCSVFGKFTDIYCPWRPQEGIVAQAMRKVPWSLRRALAVAAFVMAPLILSFGALQDSSLLVIGMREQNVSAKVSQDDFDYFSKSASSVGLAINPCRQLDATPVLHGVDVLWHKLGTYGLVRFPSMPVTADVLFVRQVTNEVTNSELKVSRVQAANKRCSEFLTQLTFDSSKEKMTDVGANMLDKHLQWIHAISSDSNILLITHSGKSADKNENELSMRQALRIKEFLMERFSLVDSRISVTSLGSTVPKKDCTTLKSSIDMKSCEGLSRRIEIAESGYVFMDR